MSFEDHIISNGNITPNTPNTPINNKKKEEEIKKEENEIKKEENEIKEEENEIVEKKEISLFGNHPIIGLFIIIMLWGGLMDNLLYYLHFPKFQHSDFYYSVIIIPALIIWILIILLDNLLYKEVNKVNNLS